MVAGGSPEIKETSMEKVHREAKSMHLFGFLEAQPWPFKWVSFRMYLLYYRILRLLII